MKSITACLLPVLAYALIGSLMLLGISYWLESSLNQQWLMDSTELMKHPQYLKSVALAQVVYLILCLVSSLSLPKKLECNAFLYALLLYLSFMLISTLLSMTLAAVGFIDRRDPYFMYLPTSLEPVGVVFGCFVLACAGSSFIFWLRKQSKV